MHYGSIRGCPVEDENPRILAKRGPAMTSDCGTDPAAGDRLSRDLHDQASALIAIGERIAAFDACIAAALARRQLQAARAARMARTA
jgi:hypothetical protein